MLTLLRRYRFANALPRVCFPDHSFPLEFRLKRSDSASLSGAKFAFQNELDEMDRTLEFRLKRSDSASLSGAKFAFQNELDEMDRTAKSS